MTGRHGTAIVLERRTGRIAAIYNQALARRALALPGSAMKPFALLALLESGKLSPSETFACPRTLHIAGHNFTCSHPRLTEPMNVERALAYSCNCFTAHFALRLGDGELAAFLRKYGFGSDGVLKPAMGDEHKEMQAIGEADVEVTPMELLHAYSKIADEAAAPIMSGLRASVEYGTGHLAQVSGLTISGKTGTANHRAWFAGFDATHVVAVMVQGSAGGLDAAPVARQVFETLADGDPRIVKVGGRLGVRRMTLEAYVAGVLAGESNTFHSAEALKAMTVAARTFAVHFRARHSNQGFDFCETTHCQNFRPDAVGRRERASVEATAGELLWYDGAPASTYYSANCGGITESARYAWAEHSAPYLLQRQDAYCLRQGSSGWESAIALDDIAKAIARAGLGVPRRIEGIAIEERTASRRVAALRLDGTGESTRISASTFRFAVDRALGWNAIPSDLYEVRPAGGRLVFEGHGRGHGLGLCQQGADQMGVEGHSYREILAYYYPKTTLGPAADSLTWQRLGGERVEVFTTEPSSDQRLVPLADSLLRQAELETGFRSTWRPRLKIYPTLTAFRNASGESGSIAGDARGFLIRLQPHPTRQTMLHELLHVVIEAHANRSLPAWFREGVASSLAGDRTTGNRVSALLDHYGKAVVLGWVSRGLPPEVTNTSASHIVTDKR